jgi:hypothetical protein
VYRKSRTSITFPLALLLLLLSGCLPAVGQVTRVYRAPSEAILEHAAQVGRQLRPGGALTPFSVESRTPQTLTLAATETVGSRVVSALAGQVRATVRVVVSVTPLGQGTVQVTLSAVPADNAAAMRALEQLGVQLDGRFGRTAP